jgi:hypothetical protein
MGKHNASGDSTQPESYQPKHGRTSSTTDQNTVVGRLSRLVIQRIGRGA